MVKTVDINTADDPACAIGDLLRRRAQEMPDRPFCYVAGSGFTFGELDRRTDEIAAGLANNGVKQGDRVALLMPNRIEFVEAYFALAKLGAIHVPLNAFLKGDFLRHQLADSLASVLIADGPGCTAAAPLLSQLPELRLLAHVDVEPPAAGAGIEVISFEALAVPGGIPPVVELTTDDTMSILYTSGTTGYPKGCVLLHGFYLRVGLMSIRALGLGRDDALFTALPVFHLSGGVWMIASALVAGIPAHFEPQFSARAFLANAVKAKATVALGVGAMCHALMATEPGAADRSHTIRLMMVAPLDPASQDTFQERFGIEPWVEVYGQTECMPLTFNPAADERDPSGCGFAAPDLEIGLLGDDLRPVGPDDVGEICIRPRQKYAMYEQYWRNPEATLKAFRGLWYHTGDSGRRLPSGQIQFVDRKQDVLRRKGENVSSLELEAAIRSLDKVAEIAVIAVPSESEDEIKACIVVREGETLQPEELFEQLRIAVPYFAMPRFVELLDALPVNAMNRVLKHVLKTRPNDGDDVWDFTKLGLTVKANQRR